jgi:flagellar basal body rod protein FlgC
MPLSLIALSGLSAAETQFDHAASQIADAANLNANSASPNGVQPGDSVSLSHSNVNLLAAKESFSANLALLKVDDGMTTRILDTLA